MNAGRRALRAFFLTALLSAAVSPLWADPPVIDLTPPPEDSSRTAAPFPSSNHETVSPSQFHPTVPTPATPTPQPIVTEPPSLPGPESTSRPRPVESQPSPSIRSKSTATSTVSGTVTGERALETIFAALDLSSKPVPGAQTSAFNSAANFGLLDAGATSAQEPVSVTQALDLAFRAMGWGHEEKLAGWLMNDADSDPGDSFGSPGGALILASQVKPAVPSRLLTSPEAPLTPEGLAVLADWLRICRTAVAWDQQIASTQGTLWLHRQGIGRPPAGWRVSLGSFETYEQASAFLKQIRARFASDVPLTITDGIPRFDVVTPEVPSAALAKIQSLHFPGSVVVPVQTDGIGPLFWVGWSPASPKDGLIVTAPQLLGGHGLPLSRYAQLTNASAAINGGYFHAGRPVGALFIDGVPQANPYPQRSMIGWKADGSTFFGSGDFRLVFRNRGNTLGVARSINTAAQQDEMGFFTSGFGARPLARATDGQLLASNGTRITPATPSTTLGNGDWAAVNRTGTLMPTDDLTWMIQWRDNGAQGTLGGLQGGPLLIKNSRVLTTNEGLGNYMTNRRHPRTLVGRQGRRLWWLAVDGRDSWHSSGLTLGEVTALAQHLGFSDLLNLDGGGSTELIYHGRIVNKPSDGRERNLPYAVCFDAALPSPSTLQDETESGTDTEDVIEQLIRQLLGR